MLDLDSRANKLQKDQQKRLQDAKKKREIEERAKKAQAEREIAMAESAMKRKEEEAILEAQREEQLQAELQLTGGIRFQHKFATIYEIQQEDDKIILSEECLTELTQQDVFRNGAMLFQLTATVVTADGERKVSITHAGVREFSAPKGSIGLPKKVVDSILGTSSEAIEAASEASRARQLLTILHIDVKYVLLQKCTYVKLQPKFTTFMNEVTFIKRCLEENLMHHATLSIGDYLTVWYRGRPYVVRVKEMKPAEAGSLLDTDVEVDLDISEEYLEKEQQKQIQESKPVVPIVTPAPSLLPTTAGFKLGSTQQSEAMDVGSNGSGLDLKGKYSVEQLTLSPETSETSNVVQTRCKLPSGKTITRKFCNDMPLLQLFVFIISEVDPQALHDEALKSILLQKLVVSTRFPARTWKWSSAVEGASGKEFLLQTFAEVGLSSGSESFFVTMS